MIRAVLLPQASTHKPGIQLMNPAAKDAAPRVSSWDCERCRECFKVAAYTPKEYVGPPVANIAKKAVTKIGMLDKAFGLVRVAETRTSRGE